MFKIVYSALVATAIFATPALSQTVQECESLASLARTVAENREAGITDSLMITALRNSGADSDPRFPAVIRFIHTIYDSGMNPTAAYMVTYSACADQ